MVLIVKRYISNKTQTGRGMGSSKQVAPEREFFRLYTDDQLHEIAGHNKKKSRESEWS